MLCTLDNCVNYKKRKRGGGKWGELNTCLLCHELIFKPAASIHLLNVILLSLQTTCVYLYICCIISCIFKFHYRKCGLGALYHFWSLGSLFPLYVQHYWLDLFHQSYFFHSLAIFLFFNASLPFFIHPFILSIFHGRHYFCVARFIILYSVNGLVFLSMR